MSAPVGFQTLTADRIKHDALSVRQEISSYQEADLHVLWDPSELLLNGYRGLLPWDKAGGAGS
jgi:hypothetical protein